MQISQLNTLQSASIIIMKYFVEIVDKSQDMSTYGVHYPRIVHCTWHMITLIMKQITL